MAAHIEHNSQDNQDGGKRIDKGTYSCIFQPALRCKSGTQEYVDPSFTSSTKKISKLMDKDNAEAEFAVSKVLFKIPLWRNYFVISESICEPAKKQTDADVSSCHIAKKETLEDLRILSMTYMGTTMNTYTFQQSTFHLERFITHLLEAGALMNLFGIVHRDLHQGNFLIDDAVVPRIIDFNLAIFLDVQVYPELLADWLRHEHNPRISQEPPDSALMNAIFLGHKPMPTLRQIIRQNGAIRRIAVLLHVSVEDMERSLEQFYHKSKAARSGDLVSWFRSYSRVIDSWAIGVILVDLLVKFSMWPGFMSSTSAFQRETLFPILRRMCAVNPMDRIDCVQALQMLDPSNFILRKYGKAWLDKVSTG